MPVIVITGASSGIGAITAVELARRANRLVLAARNAEALKEVASECARRGGAALVQPTDVGDANAVRQLAEAAAQHFGRIDVWINNAGVGAVGPLEETPIEAHERVIRTNLLGYLHGAHAVLPYFKRQRAGVLINVNSLGGWVPAPYAAAYTASKFGLRGLSEALRGELFDWPNIHVCDVYPAFIDTPGLRHAAHYSLGRIKPLPPVYPASDVANAIVSLIRRPRESVTVGASAIVARAAYALFPRLVRDGMALLTKKTLQRTSGNVASSGNLFDSPHDEPRISGNFAWRNPAAALTVMGIGLATGIAISSAMNQRRG